MKPWFPYMVGVIGGWCIGLRQVHLPWARRAKGPARGPPRYWLSANLSLMIQIMIMIIVIKATTPPTIPMMSESMLASWAALFWLGCAAGLGRLCVGLLVVVVSGLQIMSCSVVALLLTVE